MLHIHRLPIIFTIVCIGLSACAAPATPFPAPMATALPPTITPSPPTETFTPTPEPTATPTPELPTINLDLNGDGVTDYVGRIKESQNIDIPEGEPARMDTIKITPVNEYGNVLTSTSHGYITGYDTVTVSNGSREVDLTFLRVKYFRNNRPPVTVEFSFLKTHADQYGFKGEASLGKQVNIEFATPSGSDFTEKSRRKAKDVLNILDFEFSLVYPEGAQWLQAEVAVQLLKTSETDLDFKFKVRPFGIKFSN